MTPVSTRKRWPVVLKFAFGAGLIVVLIASIDLGALRLVLASVDPYFLAIMFLLPHITIAINTVKWQIFLRLLGLDPGFSRSYGLYLISTFFSNFLPTTVGGDAVRAYMLGVDINDVPSVTAATFMERMTGLAALVSLAPLVWYSTATTERFPLLWVLALACLLAFAGITAALLSPRLGPVWHRIGRIGLLSGVTAFLTKTRQAVWQTARSPSSIVISYLLSVVFYAGAAATVWAAAKSVGMDVSIWHLMVTVPIVLLAGMLPISVNGLGITEAGFAIILHLVGVPAVEAVAVGLLLRARIIVTALIGGIVFLHYRHRRTPIDRGAGRN